MSAIFNKSYFKELDNHNVELKNGQIKIKCNNNQPGIYTIYSDSCPHCVSLGPVFQKLKVLLQQNNMIHSIISGMNFNNSENKNITDNLGITYFPKVYIIKPDGYLTEFNGDSHSEYNLFKSISSYYDKTKDTPKNKKSKKKYKKSKKKSKKSKKSKKKSKKSKKSKKKSKKSKKSKKKTSY